VQAAQQPEHLRRPPQRRGGIGRGRHRGGRGGRHGAHNTFDRNAFVRSCRGLASTSLGGPLSTTTPPSMNTTWSATSRAKPISWVTTTIVIPSAASFFITPSTSP